MMRASGAPEPALASDEGADGRAVDVAPAAIGASALATAGLLVLAAALRRLELRRGAVNRRVFFVGSASQHLDLAREIGRRGDLRLVGHADVERLGDRASLVL